MIERTPRVRFAPRVSARGFLFSGDFVISSLIRVANLSFAYNIEAGTPLEALRGIDLEIMPGAYLAIVGHNGSGKSTLAKCLNGILRPTRGDVWVKERNTREERTLRAIRATVGMVFQNPDNQFVATVVEEEVAFGPENLGIPRAELRARVDRALADTGLDGLRTRNPRLLSAGQKARLAIAGILAMQPECLVLDESTAMLDPLARREVLTLLRRLHQDGLAIVAITHFMDEAAGAERVVVLEQGRIALEGTPRHVFAQQAQLEQLGLTLPPAAAIAYALRQRGAHLPDGILTQEELVQAVVERVGVRL
jgi:energy-coupling factor transporter ATPase